MSKCYRCRRLILDRYLLNVGQALFHEQCLHCDICRASLAHAERCYWRHGQILCRSDYDRQSGHEVTCAACDHAVRADQRSVSGVWPPLVHHADCFVCAVCSAPLHQAGSRVLLWNRRPICAHHHHHQHLHLNHNFHIQSKSNSNNLSEQLSSVDNTGNLDLS